MKRTMCEQEGHTYIGVPGRLGQCSRCGHAPERIAVFINGPLDGSRETVKEVTPKLVRGTHVYKRAHPHRIRGRWHDYRYAGETT